MRPKAQFRPTRSPRHQICVVCVLERQQQRGAHHWHHLISRARLRRYVDRQGLLPIEAFALERKLIHDERNLMALCASHHLTWKKGLETPVPLEVIPDGAWEFARELDMEHVLERRYGQVP
jgi:hypothetical protein